MQKNCGKGFQTPEMASFGNSGLSCAWNSKSVPPEPEYRMILRHKTEWARRPRGFLRTGVAHCCGRAQVTHDGVMRAVWTSSGSRMRSGPWDELTFRLDLRIFLRSHCRRTYHPSGVCSFTGQRPSHFCRQASDKLICHRASPLVSHRAYFKNISEGSYAVEIFKNWSIF